MVRPGPPLIIGIGFLLMGAVLMVLWARRHPAVLPAQAGGGRPAAAGPGHVAAPHTRAGGAWLDRRTIGARRCPPPLAYHGILVAWPAHASAPPSTPASSKARRRVRSGVTDAVLIDEALRALLARHRTAELDARYAVYDAHPLDEPDAWGDLASFRQAAAAIVTAAPLRGEVWWCELPEIGRRPVVVLSRDAAIPRLRRALVAPCTTTIRSLPSEVLLEPGDDPVPRRSAREPRLRRERLGGRARGAARPARRRAHARDLRRAGDRRRLRRLTR